jgi:hypothetical protein
MNQVNPFEYVYTLVSIIVGLGITQILSSVADLLYHHEKVKLYWPHSAWVAFIFFLLIQDWFVTYQLRYTTNWNIPNLAFVLSYPILLFTCAKMLLPTNDNEERYNMKLFYFSQFNVIFMLVAASAIVSIIFNLYMLRRPLTEQLVQLGFFVVLLAFISGKLRQEFLHKILAVLVLLGAFVSILLEKDVWVIR